MQCFLLVPYFGCHLWPIFGQAEEEVFLRLLNNCLVKIVRISSAHVYVIKYSNFVFVCCLNSYLIFFTPLGSTYRAY